MATRKPIHLEDGADLDSFVDRHEDVLVEFYTAGCSKCRAMEPVLGNVARATGVPIGMVNPGDDLSLIERFDIESVPALVVFRGGEPVAHVADGFLGGDEVVDVLEEHVPETVDATA